MKYLFILVNPITVMLAIWFLLHYEVPGRIKSWQYRRMDRR